MTAPAWRLIAGIAYQYWHLVLNAANIIARQRRWRATYEKRLRVSAETSAERGSDAEKSVWHQRSRQLAASQITLAYISGAQQRHSSNGSCYSCPVYAVFIVL